eukprot:CAMPEP_0198222578 /NCGR_PEP_ID=MMETSP1445-20131203/88731_1 /TAXON_ID=36898 /ORGANISM="Pyramimonas sp., Strain CCMP2087" /LENGTH=86 /DNA_ID=CAMNT_0043901129 /DNA_START=99 /DNA_END=356 /DNA_ORIENTATION=+
MPSRRWFEFLLVSLSALVLCMSSSVLGSEVEKPAVEVSEKRGGSATNEADGYCAENPEQNTSGGNDHKEAEPDVEKDEDNLGSDDG